MTDSLEYILACQICLEDFEEAGDHVPRILPCSHSLCEKCLIQLIQGKFVNCPECRKRHKAGNKEKTFPLNKYILTNIRIKRAEVLNNDQTCIDICEKHGKELSLYCKGPKCQRAICQTCLTKCHRGEDHDVVETEEIEKEALLEKMEVLVKDLEEKKGRILETKEAADNENKECIRKILTRKEELIRFINTRFDQFLADVNHELQDKDASNELTIIEDHLNLLKKIKDNADKEVVTHAEIKDEMKKITSTEQTIKDHLSGNVEYKVLQLEGKISCLDVESLCGYLKESMRLVQLADENQNAHCSWKVVRSLQMDIESLISVDGNCTAILTDGSRKLIKYRGCLEEKIQEIQLHGDVRRIVAVNLGGHPALAVTYIDQQRIEFRDAKDLNTVVVDLSIAPHSPWEICTSTSSNSSLWYEMYTEEDRSKIYQLDCSLAHEIPEAELLPFCGTIQDMCCVEQKGKSLLVVACSDDSVEAYNMDTKELVWSIRGKMPLSEKPLDARGITADKHGRLFVRDEGNKCIYVFFIHGKYVTTLLREGEQGLGELYDIWWSKGLSRLIVSHSYGDDIEDCWISIIKIQP